MKKKLLSLLLCAALLLGLFSGCGKKTEAEPFILRASVCDAIASLDLLNDPANEHLVKGCA